jgi:hypothetical protein
MELFERPDTVRSILLERSRIYRLLETGTDSNEGRKLFQEQFQGLVSPGISPEMLDWGVSKTYPGGKYE